MISDIKHLFMYLRVFFGKVSVQVLDPFLNQVICFLAIDLYGFLIYFGH